MWTKTIRIHCPLNDLDILDKIGPDPDLFFVFGDTDSILAYETSASLSEKFPNTIQIGCSTGTSIYDAHLFDDGVTICAIGFRQAKIKLATDVLKAAAHSFDVGMSLATELATSDLKAVMIFSPGIDVNGSELVRGLRTMLGADVLISGGLAGDGARFARTAVLINGQVAQDQAVAIGFYGETLKFSHGVAGGWSEFGPTRRITRSDGPVLYELDGAPALDLYEKYLGEEAKDLPGSGLIYPLKIWDESYSNDPVVRTLLSIDRQARSITLAGDVPTGWHARLMRGSIEDLIDGASEAASHALTRMNQQGAEPGICMMISCVGRRLLMGQRTEDEVEAVKGIIGKNADVVGFYSYGEIAPNNSTGVVSLHNQTVTLTLLGEAS